MDPASVLGLRERDEPAKEEGGSRRRRQQGVIRDGVVETQAEKEEVLDVSTPKSYFDPYHGEQPVAAVEAPPAPPQQRPPSPSRSPPPPSPGGRSRDSPPEKPSRRGVGPCSSSDEASPHVRLAMTATVVHFEEGAALSPPAVGGAEHDADADADEEDMNQLALPATPRDGGAKNRFVITFKDVVSPEKRESFVPLPPLAGRRKRTLPSPARRVEEEGLGDDWATRPWKEPSVEVARTARRRALVSQGRLSLWSTDPDDLLFLGPGLALYFYFVRAIALFCLLASVLHLPHLIIAWSGGMLEAYQVSDRTAGAFMAAAHMVAYPGTQMDAMLWCDQKSVDTLFAARVPCTEPVIRLFGRRSQLYIKVEHASYLITACDALTCLAFLCTWWLLARKHRALSRSTPMTSVVGTKDYAVAVRGLPEDATEEEVVQHFNRLYAVNGGDEDWTYPGSCCGLVGAKDYRRGPESILDLTGKVIGPNLQPVDAPLPRHEHPVYKRSWVVEAAIVHPMGSLIRRYKKLEKLSQELLYQRAVAKKYNPANTTFKGGKGADARKFARAQQQLRATQDRIDDEQLRLKELAGDLIKMERLCAGALVIFEHRRSRDRALRDYELYSNHLLPFVQPPPPLLFRGRHRLVVTEAPPPSDVVFENWEGSALSRLGRRVLTNLVTLVLLCMALFVVVSLRAVSNDVAAGANFDGDFCGALGDQVYQGTVPVPEGLDPWYHFPPSSPEAAAVCPAGQHYLSFFHPAQVDPALAAQGGCLDPCFDPRDKALLRQTEACPSGQTLQRETLVECYCVAQLGRAAAAVAESSSPAMSYEQMSAGGVVDLCRAPAYDYFVSQVISAVASVVTNVVNELIRFALPALVAFEKRGSLSESVTAFFAKMLLFLFLNTTGLMLLIHLRVDNSLLNHLGFFTGNAADFDLSWYLMVGLALSNTMLINAFTVQLPFLASELVVKPLSRTLQSTVGKRVSQIHLNKAFAPSAFKISTRLAMLQNTLIITLLFNSALPLLLPLAFIAFASAYAVDKFLLLRYSAKPPAYDGRLVKFSINIMPYILALHLLFAICVFGHPSFFVSGAWLRLQEITVKENGTTKTAYEALAASKTDADIVGRVFLYSTLPLCLLLAALIVVKLLAFVWQDLVGIARFMRRALSPYTQRCCARLDEEELADGDAAADDDAVAGAEEGEGGWRGQERERDPKTAKAWRRQMRTRVNNYPPYTRKFEVMYADRSRVPDFPPDCGWELELTPGIRTSQRMNVVKLVKRWLGEELTSSTAPKMKDAAALAAAAKAGGEGEGEGEEPVMYKKTWEVIKEGGGLHTYAIEAHPEYAGVMLVRAMLHLSAKSLLGLETSRRLDWSRAYDSVRELRRGWSAGGQGDDDDDDDSDDSDSDGDGEAGAERRRRRPRKVKARRAGGAAASSLLLLAADAEKQEKHRKGKAAAAGGGDAAGRAVADSA